MDEYTEIFNALIDAVECCRPESWTDPGEEVPIAAQGAMDLLHETLDRRFGQDAVNSVLAELAVKFLLIEPFHKVFLGRTVEPFDDPHDLQHLLVNEATANFAAAWAAANEEAEKGQAAGIELLMTTLDDTLVTFTPRGLTIHLFRQMLAWRVAAERAASVLHQVCRAHGDLEQIDAQLRAQAASVSE